MVFLIHMLTLFSHILLVIQFHNNTDVQLTRIDQEAHPVIKLSHEDSLGSMQEKNINIPPHCTIVMRKY